MDKYVYLVGTEAMEHASREFGSHVDKLERTVQNLAHILQQNQAWADSFLERANRADQA